MSIHKTAIISDKAKLGKNVEVGPYSIIDGQVEIGDNTKIGSFCVIEGNTIMGENCRVFTGAVIGSIPQDLKYKDQRSFLEIGRNNIIREYVTINPGTDEGTKTTVGSDNLIMAYSHIAHNCIVGNHCVIANSGTLAGHVTVENRVVIGGLVAIHQFVRVGELSIIGGCSKVVQDIPPYSTCDGHPARFYGLNSIGLRRANVSNKDISNIKQAFKILFNSGLTTVKATEEIKSKVKNIPEVLHLIEFVKSSERGLSRDK